MITLGINSFFEHPSIALLCDGKIIFAAEDERFTGIKHGRAYSPYSSYIPFDALYHGLRYCGLTSKDISEVAFSYSKWEHLRSLSGCFTGKRISSFSEEIAAFFSLCNIPKLLSSGYQLREFYRSVINPDDFKKIPFREWPHHLSHAASAFYPTSFEDALVIVADGAGENACTSVYYSRDNQLSLQRIHDLPNSLGHFYSYVTKYLGFQPFSDEFKVMGLAAYGQQNYTEQLRKALKLEAGGSYSVDLLAAQNLRKLLPEGRRPHEAITQIHKDIAKSVQVVLEEILVHIVSYHMHRSGSRNLCLAGGVFLNCVANGKLASLDSVENVYVHPASSDAGTAVGAAILSYNDKKGPQKINIESMALGTEYSDELIEKHIQRKGITKFNKLDDSELVQQVARLITENKIVATFRGRMEFGPRALGMRSLLANPADNSTKDKLNELKGRENFRPVAPIILDSAFDRYFEGYQDPHMLFTCQTKEAARTQLPSAVHADNSARVQTVGQHDNPFLYDLLSTLESSGAPPCVINTSFNIQGKPIIESPVHALDCFMSTSVDALVIGSFLIEKK
tara:strand:+ start:6129 stop:7826 length:1698 start_codon:yes stop_codon:yes gene_type:complete